LISADPEKHALNVELIRAYGVGSVDWFGTLSFGRSIRSVKSGDFTLGSESKVKMRASGPAKMTHTKPTSAYSHAEISITSKGSLGAPIPRGAKESILEN
jgi:hypothetical protein